MKVEKLLKKYHIADCARCNNDCADACPVYRFYGTSDPQSLARLLRDNVEGEIGSHRLLWGCVTCRACTESCPFDVEFADFIRELRTGRTDYRPVLEGLIHGYQRMQAALPVSSGPKRRSGRKGKTHTAHKAQQERLSWVDDTMDVNGGGDIALFIGCTPFFEAALGDIYGISPLETVRAGVKILNALGISPVLLDDERCCGRDMFDIGDRETFGRLAEHNFSILKKSGVKTVLTVCPECAYTLGSTYRELCGKLPFVVRHITDFIAGSLDRLELDKGEDRLAFHEPCYLTRYLGVTGPPRELLAAVSAEPPVEMERSGKNAPCCCAGSWVNHGPHTRSAVSERLVEAYRCGADILTTACPKCLILFNEAAPEGSWKQVRIDVKDLVSVVASKLRGTSEEGGAK